MKTMLKLIIIVVLVVLFGALPIKILGVAFEWLARILRIIAGAIDFFGWGGVI